MRESDKAAPGSIVGGRPLFVPVQLKALQPAAQWHFVALLFTAIFLAAAGRATAVQSVTLAWDPSGDSSVAGYRIHAREDNAAPVLIDVGGRTQVTVPGLKEGMRYTFTVTSYNESGVESAPSNAAEYQVPVPITLRPGATPDAAKRVQFPMAPGHWYELQASSDLRNWVTIWQTGVATEYAWTEYEDPRSTTASTKPGASGERSRFYRLVVH